MIKIKLILGAFLLLSLTSCTDDSMIPAYVHLTAWDFVSDPGQGSEQQIIESAQVLVNGNSIGVYQIPITIPVASEGATNFTVIPVIKRNGMQEIEQIFPYYSFYRDTLDLIPTEEDTLRLSTGYLDKTEFIVLEDFEGAGTINNDLDGDPLTIITKQTGDVFEGSFSGKVSLNADNRFFEAGYDTLVANTVGRGEYWLEVNYKTNMVFFFGVRAIINGSEIKNYDAGVLPNEEWNKIYFDLTPNFTLDQTGLYQFVIAAIWREDQSPVDGEIFLDNIKLLRTRQ